MKNRKSIRKNQAIAGVIEALLMVALVAIVISMIQLIYIPDIMEQREADHMDQVSNQFSYLKSMIDIQMMTESDVPISSMLTLNSDKLPYFITMPSQGIASIPDSDSAYITYDNDTNTLKNNITSIEYKANNIYFVDQTYALEGGGIFLKQDNGETAGVYPSISAVENEIDPNKIDIRFDPFSKFIGIEGKKNSADKGKCTIRTNYINTIPEKSLLAAQDDFQIFSDYPIAWKKSLENTTNDLVNIILDSSNPQKYVEVEARGTQTLNLYITEYEINVQIGIGWIK